MGTRSRLFASAAFPLLSLSLMLQPVHAATPAGVQSGVVAKSADVAGASFEVAQQQPDAQPQDDQDPRKRKKHGEQGQEGGQPQEGQKHAPAEEQKPAAQQKPAAEPKPAEAMKPQQQEEKPKPAQAAQPEAQPEAPKHKQQAQQPEAQPAPAAPAQQEAQPELKKHKQNAEQQPQAAPQPEAPARKATQPAVQQEQQPAQAQPTEPQQPAQAQQGQQQHKKHQKQQTEQAEPGAQPAEPLKPAQQEAPAKAPAAKAEGSNEPAKQPAAQAQQPAATGEAKPAVPKTQAEGQQPEAKPVIKQAQPEAKPAQQPAGEAAAPANGTGKPAQPTAQQPAGEAAAPANGTAKPAAQAQQPAAPANGAAPQAQGGQQAEGTVPQSAPVSPQELERRKKIAENPAQATGPVILPVQNGAAVLDSDKDAARRGGHGQRGQFGQGRGQAQGQGQAGQAPAVQGQGQAAVQQAAPANVRAPTSDADAQRANGGQQRQPVRIEAVTSERGQRMNGRPDFARPDGAQVEDSQDNRVILNVDNNVFVRHDDTQRFIRDGERPTYEQLSRDRYRETIDRPDGDRVVTVRNRYGDIIQRSRIDARGREYVLFYSPELEDQPDNDSYFRDPGEDLPPMRLRIPVNQYIIDTSSDQDQDYYDFLREPPVEQVERVYSLNEVRYSARIRDKVRRIDLDTITFATGSADIPMAQAKTLRGIADAINQIVKKDPTESFLIEGHTDAVGSDQSNLILSDQRAESVANVLTDVYGIPPENLATQGYGEQYLKVNTSGPEQENRRVTIRRVTALVRPVAQR
ncbi:hypothetical protein DTW90_19795 [Neorhizobium sp. P12A]|uniref:OmpA family protein n=1 Tax=Neorhizobium sp. P12A TaxID=2268027 RepID=UPI0011ED2E1C|nr:OmpA family protein [Neorhizobium sp. P12A]KAA0697627.1 hypothetical protein DTW90_19795 [Neorhizobium sp. P12A]